MHHDDDHEEVDDFFDGPKTFKTPNQTNLKARLYDKGFKVQQRPATR